MLRNLFIKPLKSEAIHETGLSGNVVASFFPLKIFIPLYFNVLSTVPRENRLTDSLYIYIYIYIYIYTRFQKRCNFKVYMIYICLLFSHQKGVDRKNNRGPFLQKERTIAAVKPFEGFV